MKRRRNMDCVGKYSKNAKIMRKLSIVFDKGLAKKIITVTNKFINIHDVDKKAILVDMMCVSSRGFFTEIMSHEGINFARKVLPLLQKGRSDYAGLTAEEAAAKLRLQLSIIAANALNIQFENIPTDRTFLMASYLQFEARNVSVIPTDGEPFEIGIMAGLENRFVLDAYNQSNGEHEIHIPMKAIYNYERLSTLSSPFIVVFGDMDLISFKTKLDDIPKNKVYYSYNADRRAGITAFAITLTKNNIRLENISDERIIIRYKD